MISHFHLTQYTCYLACLTRGTRKNKCTFKAFPIVALYCGLHTVCYLLDEAWIVYFTTFCIPQHSKPYKCLLIYLFGPILRKPGNLCFNKMSILVNKHGGVSNFYSGNVQSTDRMIYTGFIHQCCSEKFWQTKTVF